jgi:hypothetical protein
MYVTIKSSFVYYFVQIIFYVCCSECEALHTKVLLSDSIRSVLQLLQEYTGYLNQVFVLLRYYAELIGSE